MFRTTRIEVIDDQGPDAPLYAISTCEPTDQQLADLVDECVRVAHKHGRGSQVVAYSKVPRR